MKLSVHNPLARAASWVLEKAWGAGTWLTPGSSCTTSSIPWNAWQIGSAFGRPDYDSFGPVYSCISIISQDLARLPITHKRITADGATEQITTSAVSRILRKPNRYQTRSDFILYLARSLLHDGNAYAVPGKVNGRFEIEQIYPINPRTFSVYVEPTSKEIFYRLAMDVTSELAYKDTDQWFPARDVLHVRGPTPGHPLIGESPLVAAQYPTLAGMAINKHTASFFTRMGRPSGILRHPGQLDEAALERIKDRFVQLTTGDKIGEPIVLAENMEWIQQEMSAVDAEVAASFNLSEQQIFQVFRVPMFLGGHTEKIPMTQVESVARYYLKFCLAYYVDHFEQALGAFFRLPANEKIEFELDQSLLRGDLRERMEAYSKGVQNTVLSTNDARALEGLPPVEYGDAPRCQQQLVPLSYGAKLQPPNNDPEPVSESFSDPQTESADDLLMKIKLFKSQAASV